MYARKALLSMSGASALGLVLLIAFQRPVRDRIVEEWQLFRLGSDDRVTRRLAGERLAELRSLRAIPALVRVGKTRQVWCLGGGSSTPMWAVKALVKIGAPGIAAAFRAFRTESGELEWTVFEAIRELGPEAKEAIPFLAPLLADSSSGFDAALTLKALGAEAVPVLLKALERGDEEARRNAMYGLEAMDETPPAVVSALTRSLRDPAPAVRARAAEVLGAVGSAAELAVPSLVLALRDDDDNVRKSAARALGSLGPAALEAIPDLLGALWPLEELSFEAGAALEAIDPPGTIVVPEAAGRLRALHGRQECAPRSGLIWALERFIGRSAEAEDALAELLGDADPDARLGAAAAFSFGRIAGAAKKLVPLLADGDLLIRCQAAQSLAAGGYVEDKVAAVLLEALASKDVDRKIRAASALGRCAEAARPAVPSLIACLQSKDCRLAEAAADALVELKDHWTDFLLLLTTLLDERKPEVVERAAAILARIGKPDGAAAAAIARLLPKAEHELKVSLLGHLAAFGPAAAGSVPALIPLLEDTAHGCSPSVQYYASEALAKIGGAAVPAVCDGLRQGETATRAACARLLQWYPAQSAAAYPVLLGALADTEDEVRAAAANSLGVLLSGAGPRPEALRALRRLAEDRTPEVRLEAAGALWAVEKDAKPVLASATPLLRRGDRLLQGRALELLGSLGGAAAPARQEISRLVKDEDPYVAESAAAALEHLRAGLPQE